MRCADLYTKTILTVIAALLAWNTVGQFRVPAVQAQSASSRYSVEVITGNWMSMETSLATAINGAAKGRELVTVLPFDQQGRFLAVYQRLSR